MLRERSVKRGDFVLASGKRSDVYVDARLTTLRAEAMPLIGRTIIAKMQENGWKVDLVGGLTMGADPVVSAVSRESLEYGLTIDGFLIRKEAKGHGTGRFIEGLDESSGKRALIVEDTCTTGGSAIKAIERAQEVGLEPVAAICLVDREEGGRKAIEQTGCGFASIYILRELLDG